MNPRIALATAARVLGQIRHDPRTIALLLVVPSVLLALLSWIWADTPQVFDRLGAPVIGMFPFISMFLVTSITMLRERTGGTLERLMTMPLAKLDLLAGYGVAFAVFAAIQASITAFVGFVLLDLDVTGAAWGVVLLAISNAVLGMALGLFVSAFASTEFQAVQFMPAIVLPQILLCGLIAPREEMSDVLEAISGALPLTYAFDGLSRVAQDRGGTDLAIDVAVVLGCIVLALVLAAATLPRRTD